MRHILTYCRRAGCFGRVQSSLQSIVCFKLYPAHGFSVLFVVVPIQAEQHVQPFRSQAYDFGHVGMVRFTPVLWLI